MKNTKRKLTLVRNKDRMYPKSDEDHKLLTDMGVPLGRIPKDYYPLLKALMPHSVRILIVDFSDLEEAMCEKLREKFKHTVLLSEKTITLVYPKSLSEKILDKAHSTLVVWYREHYIRLVLVPKRTGKNFSLVFRKELQD